MSAARTFTTPLKNVPPVVPSPAHGSEGASATPRSRDYSKAAQLEWKRAKACLDKGYMHEAFAALERSKRFLTTGPDGVEGVPPTGSSKKQVCASAGGALWPCFGGCKRAAAERRAADLSATRTRRRLT